MYQIKIYCGNQVLELIQSGKTIREYCVSTGKNGVGEQMHSEKTPRGRHFICEKIGHNEPKNAVFVGRKPTGEYFSEVLRAQNPERDWILTRILRLKGLEPGLNLGGNVDTYLRYVYIHGCPEATEMGKPGSRGCIRMVNADIIELFDLVREGTEVEIIAQ